MHDASLHAQVGTLVLKLGAEKGCTPRDVGRIMCREGLGKSTIEKLHARAVELAMAGDPSSPRHDSSLAIAHLKQGPRSWHSSPMAIECVSDEVYLRHLAGVLDEYFDEYLDEVLMSAVH